MLKEEIHIKITWLTQDTFKVLGEMTTKDGATAPFEVTVTAGSAEMAISMAASKIKDRGAMIQGSVRTEIGIRDPFDKTLFKCEITTDEGVILRGSLRRGKNWKRRETDRAPVTPDLPEFWWGDDGWEKAGEGPDETWARRGTLMNEPIPDTLRVAIIASAIKKMVELKTDPRKSEPDYVPWTLEIPGNLEGIGSKFMPATESKVTRYFGARGFDADRRTVDQEGRYALPIPPRIRDRGYTHYLDIIDVQVTKNHINPNKRPKRDRLGWIQVTIGNGLSAWCEVDRYPNDPKYRDDAGQIRVKEPTFWIKTESSFVPMRLVSGLADPWGFYAEPHVFARLLTAAVRAQVEAAGRIALDQPLTPLPEPVMPKANVWFGHDRSCSNCQLHRKLVPSGQAIADVVAHGEEATHICAATTRMGPEGLVGLLDERIQGCLNDLHRMYENGGRGRRSKNLFLGKEIVDLGNEAAATADARRFQADLDIEHDLFNPDKENEQATNPDGLLLWDAEIQIKDVLKATEGQDDSYSPSEKTWGVMTSLQMAAATKEEAVAEAQAYWAERINELSLSGEEWAIRVSPVQFQGQESRFTVTVVYNAPRVPGKPPIQKAVKTKDGLFLAKVFTSKTGAGAIDQAVQAWAGTEVLVEGQAPDKPTVLTLPKTRTQGFELPVPLMYRAQLVRNWSGAGVDMSLQRARVIEDELTSIGSICPFHHARVITKFGWAAEMPQISRIPVFVSRYWAAVDIDFMRGLVIKDIPGARERITFKKGGFMIPLYAAAEARWGGFMVRDLIQRITTEPDGTQVVKPHPMLLWFQDPKNRIDGIRGQTVVVPEGATIGVAMEWPDRIRPAE